VDDEMEIYLLARKQKINSAFEWTPENMKKLLQLNQKLIFCFEKIKTEAETIFKILQKRMSEKDAFLHDFWMDAHIWVSINEPGEDGKRCQPEIGMNRILIDSLEDHVLDIMCIYEKEELESTLYLDKKQNWNNDPCFKGKFAKHFISQGIHELYDHTNWSFPDILKINHLCTEIKIIQQNFEDI
jgi:hypothetical protein